MMLLTTKPNVLLFGEPRLAPRGRFRQGHAPEERSSRSRSRGKLEDAIMEVQSSPRRYGTLHGGEEGNLWATAEGHR